MEASAKTDMVYQSIFEDIIRNVYDDNSILTEKMMIDKYNVSRSPVREALLRLCSEDILQSVPRMGYRLTPVSLKNILDAGALRMIIELSAMDIYFPSLKEKELEKLEELYKDGKIKAIGVSNFYPDRYIDLYNFVEIKPAINQVETHVFNQQKKAQEILKKYGTQIESWGPFAEGKNNLFKNEILTKIGDKYNKSAAQVALRFLLQKDIVVIPKSTHKERMIENFNVFDFQLTNKEITEIEKLDTKESLFFLAREVACSAMTQMTVRIVPSVGFWTAV